MALTRQNANSIGREARKLGISPTDLAAIISYETAGTFSTSKWGGTGGNYLGLIQFGPNERQKYGVYEGQPFDQQMVAVGRFLDDRGFDNWLKSNPNATQEEKRTALYSTINAGSPGRKYWSRSDNGGKDTVRSHAARIFSDRAGHTRKAEAVMAISDSATQLAAADVPIPVAAPRELPAIVPPSNDFSGATSDMLAYAAGPDANISPVGLFSDMLAAAPAGDIQRDMLAGIPGALPAAPVQPVYTASLDPVTQFPALPPAPVGGVDRAPLQDVPQNTDSAPVAAVERGPLADIPEPLPAAPVAPVEAGSMLRPAQFGGDPILANSGQFVPAMLADGAAALRAMPTTGGAVAGSSDPLSQFEFTPGFSPVEPVTPAPFGNTEQPYTGDYAVADSLRFSDFQNPMGAPYGTAQVPISPTGGEGLNVMPVPAEMPPLPDPIPVSTLPATPAQPLPVAPTSQQVEESRRSLDVTDDQYAAQLRAAGLSETEIQLALSVRAAPVPAPQVAPQMTVQPATQSQGASQAASAPSFAPPPPSGMDVWQGNSNYGVATDGSTLSRNPDGSVSRYSAKYDRWDTLNPQTGQWLPGGGNNAMGAVGDVLSAPVDGFSSMMNPSSKTMNAVKGVAGGAAGSMVGGALGLGPIGAMLGAALGKSIAEGKGFSGMFNNKQTQPATQATYDQLAVEARRSALQTNGGAFQSGSQNPSDYSYSPAAHDMANAGMGGLF